MILEPGNLLSMARLTFRVKCNNQFWGIRSPRTLSALQKQAFFMECACSYELYRLNGRRYYFGCIRSLRVYMNGSYSTPK